MRTSSATSAPSGPDSSRSGVFESGAPASFPKDAPVLGGGARRLTRAWAPMVANALGASLSGL